MKKPKSRAEHERRDDGDQHAEENEKGNLRGSHRFGFAAEIADARVRLFRVVLIVFVVQFVFEIFGARDIPESIVAQDITVNFGTHAVFAVIGAGDGDAGKKAVAGKRRGTAFYVVGDVKSVIQVRTVGNIIDESQIGGLAVARDFPGVGTVGKIFDITVVDPGGKHFDIVGVRKDEKAATAVFFGVQIDVLRTDTGVVRFRRGRLRRLWQRKEQTGEKI